jgi:hypothetical protein
MTITLSQIKTASLRRADMVNSNFIEDDELIAFINNSIEELYDIVVLRYEDYYVDTVQFTITAPNDGYSIPTLIYKVRGLDLLSGSDWLNVDRFNFEERNRGQQQLLLTSIYSDVRYKAIGSTIKIIPKDNAPGTYRLWYIPRFTDLVNDNDTLQADLEQWHEYVIVDVAIKCLQKEESDVSVLMAQKAALMNRINNAASNRDAGQPEVVTRVRNRYNEDEFFWYDR